MAVIDIQTEGNLLTVTVSGALTANEIIEVVNEYYPNGIVKHVIWDLTNGSLQSISRDGFGAIANATKKVLASGARQGGKTAYIGSATVEYGLMRMYTIIAEVTEVPIEYNAFKTIEDALIWLARD